VARIFKRCACPEDQWESCPHQWVVRYRTTGGRSSRQREQSFGDDRREAENFALKVEHDKRAHVFVDPKAGHALFSTEAEARLDRHLGADSTIAAYRSVLRAHLSLVISLVPEICHVPVCRLCSSSNGGSRLHLSVVAEIRPGTTPSAAPVIIRHATSAAGLRSAPLWPAFGSTTCTEAASGPASRTTAR